ncbi:MAG: hypothetical protein R3C09_22025 [Pirellulaceae bacterium]
MYEINDVVGQDISEAIGQNASRVHRRRRSRRSVLIVTTACLCSCLALGAGYWLGQEPAGSPPLPPLLAAAAASGDTMAMATGPIGRDSEGVFFLDFITGELQCLVYYPRMGGFGAHYVTNVAQHLGGGAGQNTKYLMLTGLATVTGTSGGARPGGSLVYVTNTTTGVFAAYAVPWNPTAETSGQMQAGALVYVGGGPIRNYQLQAPGNNKPAAIVDPKNKK